MSHSIRTRGLTKVFGPALVVNSIDLDVNTGDIFGFLGPNGAGKTTTIRLLCGLLAPTRGTVEILGLDVNKDSLSHKNLIGLLPENMGFYGWMNASEYLLHFASLYHIEPKEAGQRQMKLLEQVGLADKASAPIAYYSRGMKQRLGLARALINNPKILFLDEPTLGLDPQGQKDIKKILTDLNGERITIFLSSHILGDVASLCNRFAIIDHGTLAVQGTFQEIQKQVHAEKTSGVFVRVQNSPETMKKISEMPLKIIPTQVENSYIDITVTGTSYSANQIIEWFVKADFTILEMRKTGSNLEDIFFALTGNQSHRDTIANKEGINNV